jgi:phosphomannomutase
MIQFAHMNVKQNIFKAYDIRGVYPGEVTEDLAYAIGRGFAALFLKRPLLSWKHNKTVVVGKDARSSSPSLERELIRGLRDGGADVISMGFATTPLFYFAVNMSKAAGGIMVTASHNPAQYNGFKIVKEKAIAMGLDSGLGTLRDLVVKGQFPPVAKESGLVEKDYSDEYVDFVTYNVSNLKKFKIAVDAGNGMAGIVLPRVLGKLNLEARSIYMEPDGNFPNHEANPLKEETLTDLQRLMKEHAVDFGIAFDGDADRIRFMLPSGEAISGDIMLAFLSKAYLLNYPGCKIIHAVNCSRIVRETVESYGGTAIRWKVGHTLIKQKMRETGAVLGGEMSTHYFYKEMFGVESTMLTLSRVCQLLSKYDQTLEQAVRPFMKYAKSPETNFEVADKDAKMKELSLFYKDAKQDWLDGLTVEYKDWWFNVRPSNTEPLLRLNLEAENAEALDARMKEVSELIRAK